MDGVTKGKCKLYVYGVTRFKIYTYDDGYRFDSQGGSYVMPKVDCKDKISYSFNDGVLIEELEFDKDIINPLVDSFKIDKFYDIVGRSVDINGDVSLLIDKVVRVVDDVDSYERCCEKLQEKLVEIKGMSGFKKWLKGYY